MRDADRRPLGRLFCWALLVSMGIWVCLTANAAGASPQSELGMTTVADTVYLADGTPAEGNLIITWPAFLTESGAAVAAGTTNATLGANGALSVALVPNAGGSPAGVYYTVVYQLGPGQVKTEFWVVPATSPATLAQVRTAAGSGIAGQSVSMQYVNSELAAKANDNSVVHLSGDETIAGTKTFASAPTVPAPTSAGQVASKAYVDQAVSNSGSGNYLSTAGGTMTGPITLSANPSAAMQAATKLYVDSGLGSKADVVSGVVPATELGTGQASASNCLLGNGTWGPCAAGGTGNLSTSPTANQQISQPVGTQFSANNLANIRYVTASWNWMQSPSDNLLTPGPVTIHLSPCPMGIDTNSSANYYTYKVYIAGVGTPEAVKVAGGSCTSGASSGTITVTTAYTHGAGYTVGSASSGIQEAWNDAWVLDGCGVLGNGNGANDCTAPYVKLMADTNYYVYASVYLRGRGGILDGAGAFVLCSTRDRCIYIGTTQGEPQVHHHKLYNLTGGTTLNVDGVQVSNVSATSGLYTVTTASAHPFVAGDVVDCEWYSQTASQHFVNTVLSSGLTGTQFQMQYGSSSFTAGTNTFGFCGLLNAFIENNSDHVALQDVNITQASAFANGQFSYGIVNDNDQQFVIERASNRSTGVIRSDANFPMGAFVYERTDVGNAGITFVHGSEFTNVNCAQAGGNGFAMSDTVCQGYPVYGVRYFGGYQPSTYQNVYEESTGGTYNPLYGNIAAQMGYLVQGGIGTRFVGTFPINGYQPGFAMGGSGSNERNYFVVPRSSTLGYGPMVYAGWAQPTSSSTNITVIWPSIELKDGSYGQSLGTLTWDVLVVTGQSATTPTTTGTYALATNISASCGTNGICSFTDTQAAASTYTVPAQQFVPVFWFWPTGIVLNTSTVYLDAASTDPGIIASQGTSGVSVVAEQCFPGGAARRRTPIWVSCLAGPNNGGAGFLATVLQQQDAAGNGPFANSKGRLSFGRQIGSPNDLITLADSNLTKTLATVGERPSNDAGDMAIGLDQPGGMAERAGTSISSYINVVPTGTNFLERLTSSGKTFNVPITVNGGLSVSGGNVTLPITGTGSQCLHVNSAGVVSGTGSDCGSGSGAGTVNTGSATQVAMYSGSGASVSGDSTLTDNGTTLNYLGAGGIGAAAGAFSGNLTVSGQLQVAGPWAVSSPIPGTPMSASGAGTSSLGISNDGNFYISTNGTSPQKVATSATSSYFSNLTQEDPNDLGEQNGGTAQNLHVYSNYANSSSWQRTTLGYDSTDNLAAVRSENSTPGSALGLAFMIGSTPRWQISADSTLKPFTNNSYNIGSTTYAPQTIYAGTSFDMLSGGRQNFELCNDTTTGTALNFLAKYNGQNPACAIKSGTADTDGVLGVVSNGSGTSGSAVITYRGYAPCSFDPTAVALGDYVVASTTNAGDCHDAGTTRPSGVQVLGRVESLQPGSGTYGIRVTLDAPMGSGASLNSPTFSGTVTLPDGTTDNTSGIALKSAVSLPSGSTAVTQVSSDNSTNVATTAWVKAQGYGTGLPTGSLGQPVTNYNGGAGYETSPLFEDASQETGTTLDVKLNNANARAITSGDTTIDARALGGTQTIASEVSIGELRPPVLSSVTGTSPGAGIYKLVYTLTSPSVGETSASMESTITVDGSHAIQIASPTFYGMASSYSVYMTAAGGNSWTEKKCAAATNVAIGTAATISGTCAGGAVSLSNNGFGVTLIPPHTGTWNVSINDGVSCGLKFFDQSTYLGDTAGEGRPFSISSSSSSTSVEALACTDPNSKTGGGYYKVVGLSANNFANGAMTSSVIVRYTNDTSAFESLHAGTSVSGVPALWVYGTCCATYFLGTQLEGNSLGIPLQIGQVGTLTAGTEFIATSAVHPGATYPAINVKQAVQDLHFTGQTYVEGTNGSTCADQIEVGTSGNIVGPVTFDDVDFSGMGCSGSSAYLYNVATAYSVGHFTARASHINVNLTNLFKYPPNTALNISGIGNGSTATYPEIALDVNNPKTVITNFQVMGATSLATATATTPTSSDNSTNVATTAYVKAQGYAPLASPAFTGTVTLPSGSVGTTPTAGDNSTKVATTAYVDGGRTAPLATSFWSTGSTSVSFNSTAARAQLWGFTVPYPITTTKVMVGVVAADTASCTYDIGVLNAAGNIVVHLGNSTSAALGFNSTGTKNLTWATSGTALPGKYYVAITASATSGCATLGASTVPTFISNATETVTTSGTLNNGITIPADTPSFANVPTLYIQ